MGDDLATVLARFHREVLLPDVQRIVTESEGRLRDEMHGLFDGLSKRLDRLETEYHMLVAGLKSVEGRLDGVEHRLGSVEKRLDGIEQRLDKVALRSELLQLKTRVDDLQEQVRTLEARLDE